MDKNKAIKKAKKLLAMAKDSSSPNEAAIAARQARAIIDKYQLDLTEADLKERSNFCQFRCGKPRKKIPQWEDCLAVDIAKFNDCIVWTNRGEFVFSGYEEGVYIAVEMYMRLVNACISQCKIFMSHQLFGGCRRSFKVGFMVKVSSRLSENLFERQSSQRVGNQSLVVLKKELVEAHFGNPKYSSARPAKSVCAHSYQSGVVLGGSVPLAESLGS